MNFPTAAAGERTWREESFYGSTRISGLLFSKGRALAVPNGAQSIQLLGDPPKFVEQYLSSDQASSNQQSVGVRIAGTTPLAEGQIVKTYHSMTY